MCLIVQVQICWDGSGMYQSLLYVLMWTSKRCSKSNLWALFYNYLKLNVNFLNTCGVPSALCSQAGTFASLVWADARIRAAVFGDAGSIRAAWVQSVAQRYVRPALWGALPRNCLRYQQIHPERDQGMKALVVMRKTQAGGSTRSTSMVGMGRLSRFGPYIARNRGRGKAMRPCLHPQHEARWTGRLRLSYAAGPLHYELSA